MYMCELIPTAGCGSRSRRHAPVWLALSRLRRPSSPARAASARRGRLAIKLHQWRKARGRAADDGDHQGRANYPGAGDRAGLAADRDPHRQRLLQWARINRGVVQCRAMSPGPVDALGVAQREQQL